MKSLSLAVLVVSCILLTSLLMTSLPTASAIVKRTDFSDRHNTASRGLSNICGDHVCAPGEKTMWFKMLADIQHANNGKLVRGEKYQQILRELQLDVKSSSHPLKATGSMSTNVNLSIISNATIIGHAIKVTK